VFGLKESVVVEDWLSGCYGSYGTRTSVHVSRVCGARPPRMKAYRTYIRWDVNTYVKRDYVRTPGESGGHAVVNRNSNAVCSFVPPLLIQLSPTLATFLEVFEYSKTLHESYQKLVSATDSAGCKVKRDASQSTSPGRESTHYAPN